MHPFAKLGVAPEAPTQLAQLATGPTPRAQRALSTLECEMAVLAELLASAPVETAKIPAELSTLDCELARLAEHCPMEDLDTVRVYPQTHAEATEALSHLQSEERDPFESTH